LLGEKAAVQPASSCLFTSARRTKKKKMAVSCEKSATTKKKNGGLRKRKALSSCHLLCGKQSKEKKSEARARERGAERVGLKQRGGVPRLDSRGGKF